MCVLLSSAISSVPFSSALELQLNFRGDFSSLVDPTFGDFWRCTVANTERILHYWWRYLVRIVLLVGGAIHMRFPGRFKEAVHIIQNASLA
jgi:hypothetical protein